LFDPTHKIWFDAPSDSLGLSELHPHMYQPILSLAVFILLVGCSGHGPPTYRLAGKVTYANQPVPIGTLVFQSTKDGKPVTTAIDSTGNYFVNLPEGSYQVGVIAMRPLPESDNWQTAMSQRAPAPYVPVEFNQPTCSGLTVTVSSSQENTYDFNLPKIVPGRHR
jgi:hypothetical protein